MIVQKYGGTSVGSASKMIDVASIVEDSYKKESLIVVLSAMSSKIKEEGVTSKLINIAELAIAQKDYAKLLSELKSFHIKQARDCIKQRTKETMQFINSLFDKLSQFADALTVIRELSALSSDRILRVGEKLSAFILTQILIENKINARFVDLSKIAPINYTNPTKLFFRELEKNLKTLLDTLIKENTLPVLTGFIGEIPGGIIETIGRGYTDYTSAITASVMNASELQVWKEVDGIFTANPKIVKEANILPFVTSAEASELSYFGSEVIHPFTMEKVTKAGIDVRIKNTMKPNTIGTLITDKITEDKRLIKSITAKRNITVLNIKSNRMLMAYGFMAKVFRILEQYGVIIDLISTSEINISLTIAKSNNIDAIKDELSQIGDISIHKNKAILSIVGQNMRKTIGIAGQMFSCLSRSKINIEMISQGASEINISCVIKDTDADNAVRAIHKYFIEGQNN